MMMMTAMLGLLFLVALIVLAPTEAVAGTVSANAVPATGSASFFPTTSPRPVHGRLRPQRRRWGRRSLLDCGLTLCAALGPPASAGVGVQSGQGQLPQGQLPATDTNTNTTTNTNSVAALPADPLGLLSDPVLAALAQRYRGRLVPCTVVQYPHCEVCHSRSREGCRKSPPFLSTSHTLGYLSHALSPHSLPLPGAPLWHTARGPHVRRHGPRRCPHRAPIEPP